MTKFHDAHEAFLKWAEGKPDWSRASSNAKDWAWRAWQSCWKPAPSHLEWSGGGELKQIREALESVTNREASRFYRETMVEHALAALSRLEAREAEIPTEHNNYYGGESAAVLAVTLANGVRVVSEQLIWWMRDEIERAVQARIAAAPKTVPMAMLSAIYDIALDYDRGLHGRDEGAIRDCVARYGFKIEEDRNG